MVKSIIQTVLLEDQGDVLAFLTGQEEIEEIRMMLTEKLDQIDFDKFGAGYNKRQKFGEDQVVSLANKHRL